MLRTIRRLMLSLVVLLLLVPVTGVGAIGSNESWMVVLFNPNTGDAPGGDLIILTDQGLKEPIPVPDIAFSHGEDGFGISRIGVTPDLRYIILTYGSIAEDPQPNIPMEIVDRQTGNTFEVAAPLDYPLAYNYTVSPSGTQIAVAYVGGDTLDALNNNEIRSGLMLVNLADGEVQAQIDIEDINAEVQPNGEWALLTSWTEGDTIPFTPACFLCNQVNPEHIWLWDATASTFTETDQFYVPFGALLPESGEVLAARLNENFPIGEDDPNAYLPPSNVIEYYPAGADPREPGTVVYFDEARFPLGGAPWVADGRAFLTRKQGDPEGVLIFRDGSVQTFTLPDNAVVVVGTPTGAVIVDTKGIVYDYRVVNGEVQSKELMELNFNDSYNLNTVNVIFSTPIGESSGGKPFPTIPEPRGTALLPVQ